MGLLKLTIRQAEVLSRLRVSEEFKVFEEVVKEYEKALMERLVTARDTVLVHQSQGGVEACRGVLQLVNSAPDTLYKLTKRNTP